MSDPSRRRVLKIGAALTSVGAVGSLAGCSSILGGGGGSVGYNWMYEPGTVSDSDHYSFRYLEPKSIAENEDAFSSETYSNLEQVQTRFEFTGLDMDEVRALLTFGPAMVMSADFQAQDLEDELDDASVNLDEEDSQDGFTVFQADSGGVVAYRGSIIVATRSAAQEDGMEVFESVLEAKNQADSRYRNASEAFGALADTLGTGTIVDGGTHDPRAGLPGVTGGGSITYGETVEGELTESDPTGYRGNYDAYRFRGAEGDSITITMTTEGDPYVILLGPDGDRIASDDDGGRRDLNSRLETELPEDGVYQIVATSFSDGATFSYELELQGEGEGGGAVGGSDVLEGIVAEGSRIDVSGDTTERTWAIVFEDADSVSTGDVQDRLDSMDDAVFSNYDDVSVSKSGRTITITGSIDTDELQV